MNDQEGIKQSVNEVDDDEYEDFKEPDSLEIKKVDEEGE